MDIALSYIMVPVKDLGRVRTFYKEVLELPVISDEDTAAEFGVGGLTLAFYPCPEAVAAGETDGLYIAFEVNDIEEHFALLQSRGVQFLGAIERHGNRRVVDFLDPEGNRIGIAQTDD